MCFGLWNTLTSDPYVLDIIQFGVKLDFIQHPLFRRPGLARFSKDRELAITQELAVLLHKRVVRPTHLSPTSYVSPIFSTEKKDGSTRLILNLKRFNECIRFLQDVFDLMNPGVRMASIDLRVAYYTIPVAPDHQKCLTFSWQDVYYSYTCLPNGYSQAPYVFTKTLKFPFGYLRKHGYSSVVYIDDTYLPGDSPQLCQNNVWDTETLLWDLGFQIHPDKSVLIPSQRCKITALLQHKGDYKMKVTLTTGALADVHWWASNLHSASKFIHPHQ